MTLATRRGSGSNAAETFGGTNGGAAPGTKVLSLDAAAGRFLIPLQVRGTITGTVLTTLLSRVRFVTEAGLNRDSFEDEVTNETRTLNLGATRTTDGSPFVAVEWELTETRGSYAHLLTDADKITKVEVWMRRSNTTNAVSWTAQLVAIEVG